MYNKTLSGRLMGLSSGALWGLDTVLLGVILSSSVFLRLGTSASFVATMLHDGISFLFLVLLLLSGDKFHKFKSTLKSKSGLAIIGASLLGGPIGMGSYVKSIEYLGSSLSSAVSATYPLVGAFLAYIFLKERVSKSSYLGIAVAVLAIILLSLEAIGNVPNLLLGLMYGVLCIIGWGSEAVIISATLKEEVDSDVALTIRQMTSSLTYLIILPLLINLPVAVTNILSESFVAFLLIITAIVGSMSFKYYYKAIEYLGATQAMGLNITYPAWALLIPAVLARSIDLTQLLLVSMIVLGSILSNDIKLRTKK